MKAKLITGLVLLIPVLTFVVQNSTPVSIRFIKWEYQVSQALLLFSALLIGVVLGVLLSYFRRVKNNKKQKQAAQEIKQQKPAQQDLQQESARPAQEPGNEDSLPPSEVAE